MDLIIVVSKSKTIKPYVLCVSYVFKCCASQIKSRIHNPAPKHSVDEQGHLRASHRWHCLSMASLQCVQQFQFYFLWLNTSFLAPSGRFNLFDEVNTFWFHLSCIVTCRFFTGLLGICLSFGNDRKETAKVHQLFFPFTSECHRIGFREARIQIHACRHFTLKLYRAICIISRNHLVIT